MSTLDDVAAIVPARHAHHPWRVAVDGITASGKSTTAERLTRAVAARGRTVIHLSTDDYHHTAERRHADPDRARGYYRDAYDLDAFARLVLRPLGPGGDRRYVARHHDLATDAILPDETDVAAKDAVVVVDGSFLQSGGLRGLWDFVVWVDTSPATAVSRAVIRDRSLFGTREAVIDAYASRYRRACELYIEQHDPVSGADAVIDNDDTDG